MENGGCITEEVSITRAWQRHQKNKKLMRTLYLIFFAVGAAGFDAAGQQRAIEQVKIEAVEAGPRDPKP